MGSRVTTDRVEGGRRSRNLHHELSSFRSVSQSTADAIVDAHSNHKSAAVPSAATPPPLFLVHRIGDDTFSSKSTLDLSPILNRRLTSTQDTVQLARDEEALVEKWLGDGHGWTGTHSGDDDVGKVKKKRNVNRNWSPCVGCREKKVKCLRLDPEAPCKRCQDLGLSRHCKPYNDRAADGLRVKQSIIPTSSHRLSESKGNANSSMHIGDQLGKLGIQAQGRADNLKTDMPNAPVAVAKEIIEFRTGSLQDASCPLSTNPEHGKRIRSHFDGRTLPQPKPSVMSSVRPLPSVASCLPVRDTRGQQLYVRQPSFTSPSSWSYRDGDGYPSTPCSDTRSVSSPNNSSAGFRTSVACDSETTSDNDEGVYSKQKIVEIAHANKVTHGLGNSENQKGPWRPWTPGP